MAAEVVEAAVVGVVVYTALQVQQHNAAASEPKSGKWEYCGNQKAGEKLNDTQLLAELSRRGIKLTEPVPPAQALPVLKKGLVAQLIKHDESKACWARFFGCMGTCSGENPTDRPRFCAACRKLLCVPAEQVRVAEKGSYGKGGGRGPWKSDKMRFHVLATSGEAIVVFEKASDAAAATFGRPVPETWCQNVEGKTCLSLSFMSKAKLWRGVGDFLQPSKKRGRSTEGEEESEEEGEEEGEQEGEQEGEVDEEEGEEESEGHHSVRETDRQKQLRLKEIQKKEEAIKGSLRTLLTQIEELHVTMSGEQNPVLNMCNNNTVNELRGLAQRGLSCMEGYDRAVKELQGAWRSLSGEQAAAQFCALSAEAEAPELQFSSRGGSSSVTEEEGSSVPPEGAKLLESLEALFVADTPPQLQQLHAEYKTLYRAVIEAA